MPYIPQKERANFDIQVKELVRSLSLAGRKPGHVNYCISSLIDQLYNNFPVSYADYNEVMGILSCVTHEFYRRAVAPYEDTKKEDHGDVFLNSTL